MSTIDDVMRLPISDEAKEYYRQDMAFFASGWNAILNKPRVADLLSLAELHCCGLVDIQIVPLHTTIHSHTEVMEHFRNCLSEYKYYRTLGKNLDRQLETVAGDILDKT